MTKYEYLRICILKTVQNQIPGFYSQAVRVEDVNHPIGPNRPSLSQPRPLNPNLDIHFDQNPVLNAPPNLNPFSPSVPITVPKREPERLWTEDDFQLAVVPSSSSSSLMELEHKAEIRTDQLNTYVGQCGLPTLDFSRMNSQNKDRIVTVNGWFLCSTKIISIRLQSDIVIERV